MIATAACVSHVTYTISNMYLQRPRVRVSSCVREEVGDTQKQWMWTHDVNPAADSSSPLTAIPSSCLQSAPAITDVVERRNRWEKLRRDEKTRRARREMDWVEAHAGQQQSYTVVMGCLERSYE